jgi:hypothetical protein
MFSVARVCMAAFTSYARNSIFEISVSSIFVVLMQQTDCRTEKTPPKRHCKIIPQMHPVFTYFALFAVTCSEEEDTRAQKSCQAKT